MRIRGSRCFNFIINQKVDTVIRGDIDHFWILNKKKHFVVELRLPATFGGTIPKKEKLSM